MTVLCLSLREFQVLGSEVSSAWIYSFKCLEFRFTSAFFLSSPFFLDYPFPLGVAGRGITPLSGLYNQIKRVFSFSLGLVSGNCAINIIPNVNLRGEVDGLRTNGDGQRVLITTFEVIRSICTCSQEDVSK